MAGSGRYNAGTPALLPGANALKTSAVSSADLSRSVLAVPPLARNGDLSLNREANVAMIRHLEQGGVSTLLYGGNANLYNIGLYEYGALLDMLEQTAGAESWVIPSAGEGPWTRAR